MSNQKEGDIRSQLSALQGELQSEITTGIDNVVAMLDQMTQGEYRITLKALAEIEVYQRLFTGLMESEKGKPLAKIFSEFVKLRGLPENSDKEKILETAMLDPELTPIAFFVLTMTSRNVRTQFAERFMKKHPEKTVWIVDTGNRYGCFNPKEMKDLFEYAEKNIPSAKADVEKEMKDFKKYEKVYQTRFNGQDLVRKRIEGLMVDAGGNPALQMMTLRNTGRLIGYMASITTLLANFVANRELILKDPSQFLKNPYVLGALGVFGYLRHSSKGERLADTLLPKSDRDTRKYDKGLKKLRDILDSNEDWSNFFDKGGIKLLVDYSEFRRNQVNPTDQLTNSEKFLKYCKEHEPKGEDSKKPSGVLEAMMKKNKQMTNFNLATFEEIFSDDLRGSKGEIVSTTEGYKKILKDANERFI